MDNTNLLPENEYSEFESRRYINPNLTVEATDSFIDKLRATQQANAQQTAQQTAALGTDVPSNEGGLMGAGSYWSSRYATPQNSSLAADLRATAQAKALNDALSNEQAVWKQRYQDAYRDYQKRQNAKANRAYNSNSGSGNSGNSDNQSGWSGETDLNPTDEALDNAVPDDTQPQAPPKESDYMITGEEQNQKIEEQTGIPAWWVNILKIFG